MVDEHPFGHAEHIFKVAENGEAVIAYEVLNNLFNHPKVKNRKIVIFSTVGAYRKGKSFFLNYCLRYLYAHYGSINRENNELFINPENWLGNEKEPLKGFSWRSGSERDTTGISIWNDVFLYNDDDTEDEVAIFVMDTQGLFDDRTSFSDNSRIFALGTLISSIQVFNISAQLQEDQLQYLQFATEYAKFSTNFDEGSTEKCFQKLVFLIRDWPHPQNFENGMEGGRKYLEKHLKIDDKPNEENKSVRKHIQSSFECLGCALLPPPGSAVAIGNNQYNGSHDKMDEEFKKEIRNVIENILSKNNLVIKKIHGEKQTGSEVLNCIKAYFKIYTSNQLPEVKAIFELAADGQLERIVTSCVKDYKTTLACNMNFITEHEHISIIQDHAKYKAINTYYNSKKMGGHKQKEEWEEKLRLNIDEHYKKDTEMLTKLIFTVKQKKEEEQKRYDDDLNRLHTELERLKSENTKIEMKYDEQHKKHDSIEKQLRSDLKELNSTRLIIEQKYEELQNIYNDFEKDKNEIALNHMKNINDLKNEVSIKDLENCNLKKRLESAKSLLEQQKQKYEEAVEAIEQFKSNLFQAEKDKNEIVLNHVRDISDLKNEVSKKESEIFNLQQKLESENLLQEKQQKEYDEAKEAMEQFKSNLSQAEKDKNEIMLNHVKDASELKNLISRKDMEISKLEDKLESEREKFESEREEQQRVLKDLNEQKRKKEEIDEKLRTTGIWVPWKATNTGVPQHAVIGVNFSDGEYSYVIRADHNHNGCYKGKVPGKYCISSGEAYIPYCDKEHSKEVFEILTHTNYFWGPFLKDLSIEGYGNVYIARTHKLGEGAIGKLDDGTYYFPYGGKEHWFHKDCEVLNRRQ